MAANNKEDDKKNITKKVPRKKSSTINYNTVHTRLKSLLKYIMNLPDYQLQ